VSVTAPFTLIGSGLTILVFAFGVRRLLGLRLSIVRTVAAILAPRVLVRVFHPDSP
jgi:hypothetical protein